ncbi:hypothetical protein TKK_0007777 [Trichogramma kaykai]
MAKFCLKKPSKRIAAKRRYKIIKKVAQHNKKLRRKEKKNPTKKKQQIISVPNSCPFKESILAEAARIKKIKEEEILRKKEERKLERQMQREIATPMEVVPTEEKKSNNSKSILKKFQEVIDEADMVLEIVDARDPLGTRCLEVEETISQKNKQLIIVINKTDLVSPENLSKWLKYFKKSLRIEAVPFKSSIKPKQFGKKKFSDEEITRNSTCIGAESLLDIVDKYYNKACKNKISIQVGVIGLPNIGKSSVIDSLNQIMAYHSENTAGDKKSKLIAQLRSKVNLVDSAGIVFENQEDSDLLSNVLKSTVKIETIKDPFGPACAILEKMSTQQLMELYDITEFANSEEFFKKKAHRMGKLKKKGLPDVEAAARSVLIDWYTGKIRYYTIPPSAVKKSTNECIGLTEYHIDLKTTASL